MEKNFTSNPMPDSAAQDLSSDLSNIGRKRSGRPKNTKNKPNHKAGRPKKLITNQSKMTGFLSRSRTKQPVKIAA